MKGTGNLNANQLVHITQIGDFPILKIEQLVDPSRAHFNEESCEAIVLGETDAEVQESIECESRDAPATEMDIDHEEMLQKIEDLKIKTDHSAIEYEEEESGTFLQDIEHSKCIEMQQRSREDFDFPDEVDAPTHIDARIRFQKYRGLASFKGSGWDIYENLPGFYSQLYEVQNFHAQFKKQAHWSAS